MELAIAFHLEGLQAEGLEIPALHSWNVIPFSLPNDVRSAVQPSVAADSVLAYPRNHAAERTGRCAAKRVMPRRRLARGLAILAVGLTASGIGLALWNRWQEREAIARDGALRRCESRTCSSGFECAATCARAFVERNGYLAAALGRPESAVLESMDWRDHAGHTLQEVVASRAGQLQRDPTLVCQQDWGYQVLFPYESSKDPLWGRVVSMDKAYGSIRMEHSQMVFRGPPQCEWIASAKR